MDDDLVAPDLEESAAVEAEVEDEVAAAICRRRPARWRGEGRRRGVGTAATICERRGRIVGSAAEETGAVER